MKLSWLMKVLVVNGNFGNPQRVEQKTILILGYFHLKEKNKVKRLEKNLGSKVIMVELQTSGRRCISILIEVVCW